MTVYSNEAAVERESDTSIRSRNQNICIYKLCEHAKIKLSKGVYRQKTQDFFVVR